MLTFKVQSITENTEQRTVRLAPTIWLKDDPNDPDGALDAVPGEAGADHMNTHGLLSTVGVVELVVDIPGDSPLCAVKPGEHVGLTPMLIEVAG